MEKRNTYESEPFKLRSFWQLLTCRCSICYFSIALISCRHFVAGKQLSGYWTAWQTTLSQKVPFSHGINMPALFCLMYTKLKSGCLCTSLTFVTFLSRKPDIKQLISLDLHVPVSSQSVADKCVTTRSTCKSNR